MKAMRHAAVLAIMLGAVLSLRAADRTGPEPSDVIYPQGATATTSPGDEPAGQSALAPASLPGGIVQTAAYVCVLGLLLAGAWVLLKRGSLSKPFSKNSGRLQVLETRLLGNRQFLIVVEYEDAKMLLGVCPGRIDYLTPLAGHPLAPAVAGPDETAESFAVAGRDNGR